MLQTLMYLTAAIAGVLALAWLTPAGAPLLTMIFGVGVLFAILTTSRDGAAAVAAVLDAASRLIGR